MSALVLLLAALPAAGDPPAVDFDSQIIPLLTKAGCNTGSCHGSAAGRGGFKLSLYGSDADIDYQAIVLELEGRRINVARPDESLLLLKATETIEHGGGYRLDSEGSGAKLFVDWIAAGAPRLKKRSLTHFQVTPKFHVAQRVGSTVPLTAIATFSDGSKVDVTPWIVFTPEDTSAVDIDPESADAKLLRRGRHIVVARYLDRVVPIELIVPLSDRVVDHSGQPVQNFIDRSVLDLLTTLRLPVSPPADDATFLRRVTLDLTGRLPTVNAVREFQKDNRSDKRAKLVDRLLKSEEFNEYWTLQLAKLLRIRSQGNDTQGALVYHQWLKQQLADATPYDKIARRIILAEGDTHRVGPANFYRTVGGPREQAEFTSELFMGNRLRCANCHNHPLDRWTQDDYHGLAAIFAKIRRGRVIEITASGNVSHPRTGEHAVPRIPGERFLASGDDGRMELAAWLTARDNPYFAKAIVNRLWKAMMGRGLVEPTDDLRATNPATHPALLDRLAKDFIEHDYDLRHTLRLIALSNTYGRSARALPGNRADDRFYSHALTRPMQAEVLADAISDVTGVAEPYGDQPPGTRAVTLFDAKITSPALDILGRCSREESCETQAEASGGLTRMLHLLNGPLLNRRIAHPQDRLAKLVAGGQTTETIVEEFYLRALGRPPTAKERAFWSKQLAGDNRRQQEVLEDFLWSLLTCREFTSNH